LSQLAVSLRFGVAVLNITQIDWLMEKRALRCLDEMVRAFAVWREKHQSNPGWSTFDRWRSSCPAPGDGRRAHGKEGWGLEAIRLANR
jgi:hypothetical protein